jgi:hypothetical protein
MHNYQRVGVGLRAAEYSEQDVQDNAKKILSETLRITAQDISRLIK